MMKARIMKPILVCVSAVICFSLTACADSSVQSILDTEEPAVKEEDYQTEIPEAVISISEEDDVALTGTLTEDYYINPYFGLVFNKPEGGIIQSLLDDGMDLKPFAQTYADGVNGIHINMRNDDGSISPTIRAITEEEKGKTEEQLVQDKIEREKRLNEGMKITDAQIIMDTISIAGEEHPAYIEIYVDDDEARKNAGVYILKGDFVCDLSISAPAEYFDEMLELIEKN